MYLPIISPLLANFIILLTVTFIAAAIAGTVYSILTKQSTTQAIVYTYFISVFWESCYYTLNAFYNLAPEGNPARPGVILFIVIFSFLLVYIFFAGIMQMVTGGWKTYE